MWNGILRLVHRPILATVLLVGSLEASAHAATFTVTKLTDSADGVCDADCSLREAVIAANAAAGADTVVLKLGVYALSLAGANEDASATGDLDVTGELTIQGRGTRGSVVDGGGLDRVLQVHNGGTLTLQNLTVQGGNSGGILSQGLLTVRDAAVVDNHGGGAIGAIGTLSGAALVLERVLIANNTSDTLGGGVTTGVPTTIVNCTFSNNEAIGDFGGGIYVFSMTDVTIQNSTFTLNRAPLGIGGGLLLEGDSAVTISNTLIAGNSAGAAPDCSGLSASLGYNLVGDATGCTGFTATGDQAGTSGSPINALLGTLAANGGLSDTHALLPGSPALNTGNPATSGPGICASTDQRGLPRTVGMVGGSRCDIGAFADEATFADGFQSGDLRYWIGVGEVVP